MYSKQRGGRYKLPGHQIWGFRRVLPPGGLELGTGGAEPFGPSSSRTLPPTHLGRLVFLILIIIDNFFFFLAEYLQISWYRSVGNVWFCCQCLRPAERAAEVGTHGDAPRE